MDTNLMKKILIIGVIIVIGFVALYFIFHPLWKVLLVMALSYFTWVKVASWVDVLAGKIVAIWKSKAESIGSFQPKA